MPPAVPAGPLAVRWLGHDLPKQRAGARSVATVEAENVGSVTWRGERNRGIHISYHWLDLRGNPIVWAGLFTPLYDPIPPGDRAMIRFPVRAPVPPGRYRLAIDFVDEGRAWFAELGNERIELDVEVGPRIAKRSLAVQIADGPAELVAETDAALAAQEESLHPAAEAEAVAYLAAGCRPAPDWSRRILDAHAEGYAAVGGSIAVDGGRLSRRRAGRELEAWKPGFGRSPGWTRPLLCPSVVSEARDGAPFTEPVSHLPALRTPGWEEPWLCDGRIVVSVTPRALKRAARLSG
jgi:hypothetical protein